jgi:hypothetical protein
MPALASRRTHRYRVGMGWFAVRHVVKNHDAYEERVTLWHAADENEAVRRAEEAATEYVGMWDEGAVVVLPLFQSFRLSDPPADGAEVFSLIRRSALSADDYLAAFFDTGSELQRQ